MKRRSGSSTRVTRPTRLIAQQSSADQSVTLFKLEDPDDETLDAPVSERHSKRIKAEAKAKAEVLPSTGNDDDDDDDDALGNGSRSKKRAKTAASPRKAKAKEIKRALDTPHPAPAHWRETYDAIREMRARLPAPVDTMGCDTAKWKETEPRNKRFATLISLMLSSQTKDEVTDAAVDKLRAALGGTVSLDALLAAEEHVIADCISKVGFWRRKTQYIKQAAQRLRDEFDSDVPKTVDELCSLPGVGPKMAFLCLHAAWDINVGIGVDVHVQRITNRLKWHKPPTKNPEETRLNLQSWLPTEFHKEINHLLVGFGQVVCLPIGPKCNMCTLSTQNLCPSAQTVAKSKVRKSTAVKPEPGPKIEIAIEETVALALPKAEPASPCLSALSSLSLTPEPESG
ncbi:DNA glycosylase [Lactarius deliciosus]|nr:DNA glycosylase [Lactarius deliciosus]